VGVAGSVAGVAVPSPKNIVWDIPPPGTLIVLVPPPPEPTPLDIKTGALLSLLQLILLGVEDGGMDGSEGGGDDNDDWFGDTLLLISHVLKCTIINIFSNLSFLYSLVKWEK